MAYPADAATDATPVTPFRTLLNAIRDYLRGSDTITVNATPGGTGAGFTGSITLRRVGKRVSVVQGSLSGTPASGSTGLVVQIPSGWRTSQSFKALVGSSGTTNSNVRLLAVGASGDIALIWSGAFGGAAGTGGSGVFLDGLSWETA